jgi:drug/metabolite transporter (DMT)-like permease
VIGFTVGQFLVGAPVAIALAFALEGTGGTDWSSADFWGAIAWLAIGASAIAYVTFFAALEHLSATTVTAWQFLVPVVAVLVEIGRGDMPEAVVLVGMGLAIAGVALVNVAPLVSERLSLGRRGIRWSYSTRAR